MILPAEPTPIRAEPIVQIRSLSRRFGQKLALDNVNFNIRPGSVVGLVGENGAGKTTLIKHILGLLKAQSGSVRVFGLDPVADPVAVLSNIGYLSEEPDMPGWMAVHQLLRYIAPFYPNWDHGYAEQLQKEFSLDPMAKIKNLSRGQRARAGLLIALVYRPKLLVLDEPSSGLDPIVRRDILGAIIRTIAVERRTVLFSSHLLSEVERVSDYVAMVRGGRIVFCDSMQRIKALHSRLKLRFNSPQSTAPLFPGALTFEGAGENWTAICTGPAAEVASAATHLGARIIEQSDLSLDEIFLARTGNRPNNGTASNDRD